MTRLIFSGQGPRIDLRAGGSLLPRYPVYCHTALQAIKQCGQGNMTGW